jgi:hypothetical protein
VTTRDELLDQLGSPYTNEVVARLHRFAFVPDNMVEKLAKDALSEQWGANNFVLRKYLAVHVPWAIEQERFTLGKDQLYVTAGHLQTRYGTPLFLVFQRIDEPGKSPWRLVAAGAEISAPELPTAPEIPAAPDLERGAEIVMLHDHILGDNSERVSFLASTPPVAQMCAVAGAIQWSLNRSLQLNHWYFGRMNYIVPLYLQSRENITRSPDIIAPIQVSPGNLVVGLCWSRTWRTQTRVSPYADTTSCRRGCWRHGRTTPRLAASCPRTKKQRTQSLSRDDRRRLHDRQVGSCGCCPTSSPAHVLHMQLNELESLMRGVAGARPIFHSEADFQHAFAWQLHTTHPEARVRLETRPARGVRVDVLATINGIRTAFELKYLVRGIKVTFDGELFELPNQGAQDLRRYDFVKDVARLEVMLRDGAAHEGYAIALTNDPSYWQGGDYSRFIDAAFRIDEGRKIEGVLRWAAHAGAGTTRGRDDAIALTGSYDAGWRDFSKVPDARYGSFRYLAVEVS